MKQLLTLARCLLLTGLLAGQPSPLPAQTDQPDHLRAEELMQIEIRLRQYTDEISSLEATLSGASAERLKRAERSLKAIGTRWNTYFQTRQSVIADDESLLDLLTHFEELQQETADSIVRQQQRLNELENFKRAERFIAAQDTVYKQLQRKALELSVAPQLAGELERLKGSEQLLLADIEGHYGRAEAASQTLPQLKKRMQALTEQYISLKTQSAQIQETVYKPFIERAKDYLLGMAAVAIVLMFVNAVVTKLKMLQQARENAKKYQDMLNQNNQDYPTI